jgi:hypothetical protein
LSSTVLNGVAPPGVKSAFSSVAAAVNVMTGALEIEIPQYGVTHMRFNRFATTSVFNTPIAFEYVTDVVAAAPVYHYRQSSDDSDFGFFYGVLPLIPSTGTFSSTVPW